MVDKVWSDWQKRSFENFYSYGGLVAAPDPTQCPIPLSVSVPPVANTSVIIIFPRLSQFANEIPGDGLWGNVKVWDVIDTKGDILCYDYA